MGFTSTLDWFNVYSSIGLLFYKDIYPTRILKFLVLVSYQLNSLTNRHVHFCVVDQSVTQFNFRRMFIATTILSLQAKQILYNWQVFHTAYKIHMRVSF